MTSNQPHWEDVLWDDLLAMSPDEQIIASGEWITHITQTLLTRLGRHRRLAVIKALSEDGVDAAVLADRIGGRRTTLERLAAEARALRRDEARDEYLEPAA